MRTVKMRRKKAVRESGCLREGSRYFNSGAAVLIRTAFLGSLLGLSGCVLFESPYNPPSPNEFSAPAMIAETEAANDPDSSAWYNSSWLRFWFGDFRHTDRVFVTDPASAGALIARGEKLVKGEAACGVCHAGRAGDVNSPLSGGRLMKDRFGELRAANLTPAKTGIAGWNVFELMRAIRASIDRTGKPLSLDLHQAYRWISDQDAKAISVYLLSLPPAENEVERRVLGGLERNRWGIIPLHTEVVGYVPAPLEEASLGYGRYLANHLSACVQCHTADGAKSGNLPFGGAEYSETGFSLFGSTEPNPEKLAATGRKAEKNLSPKDLVKIYGKAIEEGDFPLGGPDIRGKSENSLKSWSEENIIHYLTSGTTPKGEARDKRLCPWDHFANMPQASKRAIAMYLKSL